MNKGKIILVSVLVLIIIGLSGFIIYDQFIKDKGNNNNNNNDSKEVKDLVNKNSNLPVEYMSKEDEIEIKGNYQNINNYMSDDYYNDDIEFSFYGYPNDESDFYLGHIKLKTNKYNLLGVTIGDNMGESVSKIEKYGFTKSKKSNDYSVILEKDDYTILIESEISTNESYDVMKNGKVYTISISVDSEYLGNKVY